MRRPAIHRPCKAPRTYPPSCTFCWTPYPEPSRVGLCSRCAGRPHYVRAVRQIARMLDSRGRLRGAP